MSEREIISRSTYLLGKLNGDTYTHDGKENVFGIKASLYSYVLLIGKTFELWRPVSSLEDRMIILCNDEPSKLEGATVRETLYGHPQDVGGRPENSRYVLEKLDNCEWVVIFDSEME